MNEISVILRNHILITIDEFRILDRYSSQGRLWALIQKPSKVCPFKVQSIVSEYIFYPEDLTMFCIVSKNILVSWDTDRTKHMKSNEEFQIDESLFISPL